MPRGSGKNSSTKNARPPVSIELVFAVMNERGYTRKPGVESLADRFARVVRRLERNRLKKEKSDAQPPTRRRRKAA